jgi:hypothetical protein
MGTHQFGGNLGLMLTETLNAAQEAATFDDLRGCGTVSVQLAGTFTATVTFEVSNDGTTWSALPMGTPGGAAPSTTATAAGLFVGSVAGYHKFRTRCSAYTSGDIVATQRAVPGAGTESALVSGFGTNANIGGGTAASDNATLTDFVGPTNAAGAAERGLAVLPFVHDGTNADIVRSAGGASNTTGTGLLGVGPLVFDGTNWQQVKQVNSADAQNVGVMACGMMARSGSTQSMLQAGGGDGDAGGRGLNVQAQGFNETTWDKPRNNTDVTVLASASRTTTQTVTFTNYNSTYLRVVLDMTVVGTGSVTLSIDAQDTVSGKWVNLLTGAAVITNSTNVYTVGPGLPVTANVSANQMLSRFMRIVVTANNANAATYSVGRQLTGQ